MFLDVTSLGKNRVRGVFPVFIPSVEDAMGMFKYNQETLKNLTISDTSTLNPLVDVESAREVHMNKDASRRGHVKSLYPGVSFELRQLACGFELVQPGSEIPVTEMPLPEILEIIRNEVDPKGVFTGIPGM